MMGRSFASLFIVLIMLLFRSPKSKGVTFMPSGSKIPLNSRTSSSDSASKNLRLGMSKLCSLAHLRIRNLRSPETMYCFCSSGICCSPVIEHAKPSLLRTTFIVYQIQIIMQIEPILQPELRLFPQFVELQPQLLLLEYLRPHKGVFFVRL